MLLLISVTLFTVGCNQIEQKDVLDGDQYLFVDGNTYDVIDILFSEFGILTDSITIVAGEIFTSEGDVLTIYMRSYSKGFPIDEYKYLRGDTSGFKMDGAHGGSLDYKGEVYTLDRNYDNQIKISAKVSYN